MESSPNSRPLHETLYNTELGYKLSSNNFKLGINAYYMIYENQLVLTGQINDVGAYTEPILIIQKEKELKLKQTTSLTIS